jgi:tetratricopeptide (TPR) repeat protein
MGLLILATPLDLPTPSPLLILGGILLLIFAEVAFLVWQRARRIAQAAAQSVPAIPTPAPSAPVAPRAMPDASPLIEPEAPTTPMETATGSAPLPETPPATIAPRVFVSHSSADNAFGLTLERRLKDDLGPDAVFYDADGGLHAGDEWLSRLEYEIGTRNVFALILSPDAFASGWVAKELRYALRRTVSVSGMVIVPILHRDTDVWPFLGEYQHVDFREPEDPAQRDGWFEQRYAELLAATHLGRSRLDEVERMRQLRLGPPYDLVELPIPERFVGREQSVEWTLRRLAPEEDGAPTSGLASIAAANGLGGIGKSALAGQVARILYATNRFPDGIAVVRCNGLSDPAMVLRRALSRFDPQRSEPQDTEPQALHDLARQIFSTRRALVILDNVEADWPVEQVVQPLRAAGAAVLLTSRVRMPASAVPQEASRMLEILSPDEAEDLFAEYFGRGAGLDLTLAEQEQVGRIVRALGYHTLAVKLAAARAQGRDLEVLAREYEVDRRLGVNLKDGTEAVHAMLVSSLAALSEPARRLFALLAAFATAEVGRRAILGVAERLELLSPSASLEALTDLRLADAIPNAALSPQADRERVRLHPLVRTYAEEQFETWDEQDRGNAQMAVAVWYAAYTNAMPNGALAPDEENIIGALRVAHAAANAELDRLAAQICGGMAEFWRNTGRTQAGLAYLPWGIEAAERAAERTNDPGDRKRAATIVSYYGDLLRMTGRLAEAEEIFQRTLELHRKAGDRRGEEAMLGILGSIARTRGQLAEAQDFFEQSLAICREVGDRREEAVTLNNLGQIARQSGRRDEAQDFLEQSLAICREVGDRLSEGTVLNNLGHFAFARGQGAEAQDFLEQALVICREVGDRRGEGITLGNLGGVARARGRLEEAQSYYEQALAIAQEMQYAEMENAARSNLVALAELRGTGEANEVNKG